MFRFLRVLFLLVLVGVCKVRSDDRRPFYNIGHMANSICTTKAFLEYGANAIEVDVQFDRDDLYLFHGDPCDIGRNCRERVKLRTYLDFIRGIGSMDSPQRDERFVLLYLDLKISKYNDEEQFRHGVRLADMLTDVLYQTPKEIFINLVFSLPKIGDWNFARGVVHQFKHRNIYDAVERKIGFDLSEEWNFERSEEIWRTLNVTNVWQGQGITNIVNVFVKSDLQRFVDERNNPSSKVKKIYWWTVDLRPSMEDKLELGLDGLMTNYPKRLSEVIGRKPYSNVYRLATRHDSPFEKFLNSKSNEEFETISKDRKKPLNVVKNTIVGTAYVLFDLFRRQ